MSEFSSWFQSNWNELATFLVEVGFLAAAIWFGRNVLRMLRSFQEQIGALLKLNIAQTTEERESLHQSSQPAHAQASAIPLPTPSRSSLAEESPYWMAPSISTGASEQHEIETVESGPSWIGVIWHGLVGWLNAPMKTARLSPWRRIATWLQTPAGS